MQDLLYKELTHLRYILRDKERTPNLNFSLTKDCCYSFALNITSKMETCYLIRSDTVT